MGIEVEIFLTENTTVAFRHTHVWWSPHLVRVVLDSGFAEAEMRGGNLISHSIVQYSCNITTGDQNTWGLDFYGEVVVTDHLRLLWT